MRCAKRSLRFAGEKGTVAVILGDGEEDEDAMVLVVVGGGVDGLVVFSLGAKKQEMICCVVEFRLRLSQFMIIF